MPGAVEKIYSSMAARRLEITTKARTWAADYGPYIQSQRKDLYLPYAKQLVESGHAYYCFCTKERLDQARRKPRKRAKTSNMTSTACT